MAYSSPRFAEMLPTFSDKIEHFLSAYLGLSDERRWRSRVENKLKRAKSAIQDLRSKVASASAANEKRSADENARDKK